MGRGRRVRSGARRAAARFRPWFRTRRERGGRRPRRRTRIPANREKSSVAADHSPEVPPDAHPRARNITSRNAVPICVATRYVIPPTDLLAVMIEGDEQPRGKRHDLPREQEQDGVAGKGHHRHAGHQHGKEEPMAAEAPLPPQVGKISAAEHGADGRQEIDGKEENPAQGIEPDRERPPDGRVPGKDKRGRLAARASPATVVPTPTRPATATPTLPTRWEKRESPENTRESSPKNRSSARRNEVQRHHAGVSAGAGLAVESTICAPGKKLLPRGLVTDRLLKSGNLRP